MSRVTLCNMLGVILLLSLCPLLLQAQTLKIIKNSPDPTYVTLGDTLELHVTYENADDGGLGVGVAWRNNSNILLIERLRGVGGGGSVIQFDPRASLKDQTTLVLTNTQVYDNGKYSVIINANNGVVTTTFDVIIQETPTTPMISTSTSAVTPTTPMISTNTSAETPTTPMISTSTSAVTPTTPMISTNTSAGNNLTKDCNCEKKWYIIAIEVISAICFFIFLCGMCYCCGRD